MRKTALIAAGGLYALFNTGVYTDSALQALSGFSVISPDYHRLFSTVLGSSLVLGVALMDLGLLSSLTNTYVRKSVRYFNDEQIEVLPSRVATVAASVCAVTKSLTSNASTALTLASALLSAAGKLGAKPASETALVLRIVAFLLINVLTLPSTFYAYYAIGFNESTTKAGRAHLSPLMKRALASMDRLGTPATHGIIANMPSMLMYVLEGYNFTRFIARFAQQGCDSDYALPMWLSLVSVLVNSAFATPMSLSYNERYREEIDQLSSHVHENVAGYRPMPTQHEPTGDSQGCWQRMLLQQKYAVTKNANIIKGSSSFYKALIMTGSTLMLVYELASNDEQFEAGHWQWSAGMGALAAALLNLVVCYLATRSFLFEAVPASVSLPRSAIVRVR